MCVETWLLYATDCNPTTASPQTMESAIQNKVSHALMCIPRPQRARPRVSASQSPPGRACDATCPVASRLPARRRRRLSLRRRRRRPPRPPPPPPSTLCASPPPPPHHRRSRGRAGRWGTQAERQGCAPLHLRHLRVRLVELRRDQARRRRCVRDAGGAGHRPDADGFGRASAGMRLCGRLSWRAVQREAGADRRGAAPAHRASGVHSRQARCAARCAARGAVSTRAGSAGDHGVTEITEITGDGGEGKDGGEAN